MSIVLSIQCTFIVDYEGSCFQNQLRQLITAEDSYMRLSKEGLHSVKTGMWILYIVFAVFCRLS